MVDTTYTPYFSQWQDPMFTEAILAGGDPCNDPSWVDSGFDDPEHYRFWAIRMCGLACFRSILAAHSYAVPTQRQLLEEALNRRVFERKPDGSVLGLIYKPFCEWISEVYEFRAQFFEATSLEDALALRRGGQFLILSVGSNIRQPELPDPVRGGHLVLVTSHDKRKVMFHNPSGIPPQHAHVRLSHEVFEKFYAGRGIHVAP